MEAILEEMKALSEKFSQMQNIQQQPREAQNDLLPQDKSIAMLELNYQQLEEKFVRVKTELSNAKFDNQLLAQEKEQASNQIQTLRNENAAQKTHYEDQLGQLSEQVKQSQIEMRKQMEKTQLAIQERDSKEFELEDTKRQYEYKVSLLKQITNERDALKKNYDQVKEENKNLIELNRRIEKERNLGYDELQDLKNKIRIRFALRSAEQQQDSSQDFILNEELEKIHHQQQDASEKVGKLIQQLEKLQQKYVEVSKQNEMYAVTIKNLERNNKQYSQSLHERDLRVESLTHQAQVNHNIIAKKNQQYIKLKNNYNLMEEAVQKCDLLMQVKTYIDRKGLEGQEFISGVHLRETEHLDQLEKEKELQKVTIDQQQSTIAQLQEKVRVLEAESKKKDLMLANNLQESESLSSEQFKRIFESQSSLSKTIQDYQAKMQSLTEESFNLKRDLQQKAFEVKELEHKVERSKQSSEDEAKRKAELQILRDKNQKLEEELRKAITEKAQEISTLDLKCNQLANKVMFLEQSNADFERRVTEKQNEVEAIKESYQEQIQTSKKESKKELSSKQKEITSLKTQLESIQNEANEKKQSYIQHMNEVQVEITNLKTINNTLERQLQTEKALNVKTQELLSHYQKRNQNDEEFDNSQMSIHEYAKSLKKEIQELQALLLKQKEESKEVNKENEIRIESLLKLIQEQSEMVAQKEKVENELATIKQTYDSYLGTLNTQVHNDSQLILNLKTENAQLQEKLKAIFEEKDQIEMLGMMHSDELRKVMAQKSGEGAQVAMPGEKFKEMSLKVDEMQLRQMEQQRKYEFLKNENEILKETLDREKKSFLEQLNHEQEKAASLNKQLSVVTEQLNKIRNLSQQEGEQIASKIEIEEGLKERILHLEQQISDMSFENLKHIEQLKLANSSKNEINFKYVQLQEEHRALQERSILLSTYKSQMQDLNEENSKLREQINELRTELEVIRAKQQPAKAQVVAIDKEAAAQLKAQLVDMDEKYTEVVKEVKKLSEEGKIDQQNPNTMVIKMFKALQRAKHILEVLCEKLGEEEDLSVQIGQKRQRYE